MSRFEGMGGARPDETPRGTEEVRERSIRAVKWSALTEWLTRTVQPITLLVLAKLLTPRDFGVVAVATIVIGVAQIFHDLGLGKALIQSREDVTEDADSVFWLNLAAATILYALVFVFAGPIAAFFRSPESEPVLRVLGLQIVLSSLISVQSALLQRGVRFDRIFLVRLLPTLITGGVSIWLALEGMGAWALVVGTLSGTVVQVALYWIASSWRPRALVAWAQLWRMVRFSRWVTAESLLAWLIQWGDAVALGHFLGPELLGMYRMGSVIVAYASNIIFTPLVPVSLSLLSRMQDDHREFVATLGKLTRVLAFVALPVGMGMLIVGPTGAEAVLGDEWAAAGVVVQLMGLRMALGWLVGLNSTAFIAAGRPDVSARTLLIAAALAVPTYVLAAPFGLVVFCWARLGMAQVDNVISYLFARRVLGVPSGFIWERVRSPLISVGVMGAVLVVGLKPVLERDLLGFTTMVGAAALVYFVTMRLIDPEGTFWGFRAIRRVLRKQSRAPWSNQA